jgi:hypothetical protein
LGFIEILYNVNKKMIEIICIKLRISTEPKKVKCKDSGEVFKVNGWDQKWKTDFNEVLKLD